MIDPMSNVLHRLLVAVVVFAIALPVAAQEDGVAWEEAPASEPAESVAPEPTPTEQYADTDPSALTDFDPALQPYGRWRDDPTYGRVWVPDAGVVGPDFAPYVTSGHWALTADDQWIWVSDYPFGWVVFHYGRWVWIDTVGWAWIPGRQYAHAWVVWRVPEPGYYYVGWSPMPPDYIWVNGVAVGVGFGVYYTWVFCPSAYVYHPHVHHYIVHDHHHVHYIAGHTHRYRPPRGKAPYAGPSPKKAHIPASAVPKQRTAANPKAVAASRGGSGTTPRKLGPVPAGRTLQNPRGAPVPARAVRPARSGARTLGQTFTPSRPAPSRTRPTPIAPPRAAPAPGRYSQPSPPPGYRPSPAPRSAPSPGYGGYRPAPAPRSAPQRAAPPPPERSAPARSAPPARFSPPSRAAPPPRPPPPRSSPAPSRGGGRGRR